MDRSEKRIQLEGLVHNFRAKHKTEIPNFKEKFDSVFELSEALSVRIDSLGLEVNSFKFLSEVKEFLSHLSDTDRIQSQNQIEESIVRISEAIDKCCSADEIVGVLEDWKELSALLDMVKDIYEIEMLACDIKAQGKDILINEMDHQLKKYEEILQTQSKCIGQHDKAKQRLEAKISEFKLTADSRNEENKLLKTMVHKEKEINQTLDKERKKNLAENIRKAERIELLENLINTRNNENKTLSEELGVEKVKSQRMKKSHEECIEAIKSENAKNTKKLEASNEHLARIIERLEGRIEEVSEDLKTYKEKCNFLAERCDFLEENEKRLRKKIKILKKKHRLTEKLSFETIFISTYRENFRIMRSEVMRLSSESGFKKFLNLADHDISIQTEINQLLSQFSISFEGLKELYRYYKKCNEMIHEGLIVSAESIRDIKKSEHFQISPQLLKVSEKLLNFMEVQRPMPNEKKFCTMCCEFSHHLAANCGLAN